MGLLTTNKGGSTPQRVTVATIQQDLNPLSDFHFDYVSDSRRGILSNQTSKEELIYGWHAGRDLWQAQETHLGTWEGRRRRDATDFYQLSWNGPMGHPGLNWVFIDIGPQFV